MTAVAPPGPLVLVGLMATGKTTTGHALAATLDRLFFDSDEMVEAATGKTVAELWAEGGEAAFRGLETAALTEALSALPPAVIAAAGGVVLAPDNRRLLRAAAESGAVVVWLRARAPLLAMRVSPGDHRPLLTEDPAGTLAQMERDREGLYAEVADATVDVDGLDVETVTATVLDRVAAVVSARAARRP